MDLNFTAANIAFRQEVIEFLEAELPTSIATKVKADIAVSKEATEFWHATLHKPPQARRASYPLASKCLHPC